MKLRMHENSLFAILLRSPWWISIAIAGALIAAARLILPDVYAVFVGLPFGVIGGIALWRQIRAPSEARVAKTVDRLRGMSWEEFSQALESAFRREGYTVNRLANAAADFELKKGWRVVLVSCKRWKVARTGVEPLRELDTARRAHEAHEGIYVATGEVTDKARAFAAENRIRLAHGAELVRLVGRLN